MASRKYCQYCGTLNDIKSTLCEKCGKEFSNKSFSFIGSSIGFLIGFIILWLLPSFGIRSGGLLTALILGIPAFFFNQYFINKKK